MTRELFVVQLLAHGAFPYFSLPASLVVNPVLMGLYPQQDELCNTLNLSGIQQFKKNPLPVGENEGWQKGLTSSGPSGVRPVAVPGSWNEHFTDICNYLGLVWYEQETYVPSAWKTQRIFIRVGSANYRCQALGKRAAGGRELQEGLYPRLQAQTGRLLPALALASQISKA